MHINIGVIVPNGVNEKTAVTALTNYVMDHDLLGYVTNKGVPCLSVKGKKVYAAQVKQIDPSVRLGNLIHEVYDKRDGRYYGAFGNGVPQAVWDSLNPTDWIYVVDGHN